MTGWTPPGPDPSWERARREALAEAGLEHLARFRAAARDYGEAADALAELIAATGGDPDAEVPGDAAEAGDVDGEDGWTRETRAAAGRWLRRTRETFEAVAVDGGGSHLPAERRAVLLRAGLPPERLDPWPTTPSLEDLVAEARRWADVAEGAVP